jgi:hypothetical protein
MLAARLPGRRPAGARGAYLMGSQSSTGALRIKMHNKLAALVALGKHLGMFVQRAQNPTVHYFVSDEPMSPEEWEKEFVTKD